jgi:putative transposase
MPRNARVVAPDIPYHVTQRGTNRQPVFFTTGDRKLYLQLIRENKDEAGVRVLAYCLMTNHIHFLVVPERENSLALLFGRANGRYAQALNIRRGRSGHLWQARYHSCPMSPSHLEAGLRYVEANPCRAGIVERPEQHRWSSAPAHLLGEKDFSGVLDLGFWRRAGGAAAWTELHGRAENPRETTELRSCTYAGRPFGSDEFVREMEARFQRKWLRSEKRKAEFAKTA